METLGPGLTGEHGVYGLLAGLIVMLAINLFKEIGKFAWDLAKKRNEVTAEKIKELTDAVSELTTAIQEFKTKINYYDQKMADINVISGRLKLENKRLFFCLKDILGEKFNDLMKQAAADDDFL